ncbi:MAG: hypothetical protein ACLTAF_04545 [Blautia coccoides]
MRSNGTEAEEHRETKKRSGIPSVDSGIFPPVEQCRFGRLGDDDGTMEIDENYIVRCLLVMRHIGDVRDHPLPAQQHGNDE